jgi:hypothetical protein
MNETQMVTAIRNHALFTSHLRYEHMIDAPQKYNLEYLLKIHAQDHATGVKIHGRTPHTLRKLH